MSFMNFVKVIPQYFIPQHLLSSAMHRIMQIEQKWIKNTTIKMLTKIYKIDITEAKEQDLDFYKNFNEFFTRELLPEARPIQGADHQLVSPADGTVSESGKIDGNQLIQAKKHNYTLEALLGGDIEYARHLQNGNYSVVYLSPKDYHRVHMPLDGHLYSMTYVPGDLFAVNPATVELVPGLLARNERLIMRFNTQQGSLCLIMVGAIFVGSMETVFEGKITPTYKPTIQHWNYAEHKFFAKGAEIGRFNMGSTVVMLSEENTANQLSEIEINRKVEMGEIL